MTRALDENCLHLHDFLQTFSTLEQGAIRGLQKVQTLGNVVYYHSVQCPIRATLRSAIECKRSAWQNFETLQLCDGETNVCAYFIDVEQEHIDEIVWIEEWVLAYAIDTQSVLCVEVHAYHCMSTQNDLNSVYFRQIQSLRSQILDPPLYHSSTSLTHIPQKRKKGMKSYTVFGRIYSQSPLSHQKNPNNSHCFLEIEHQDTAHNALCTVSIMLIGTYFTKLYSVMVPGKFIYLLNVIKVYAKGSDKFLFQKEKDVNDTELDVYIFRASHALIEQRLWHPIPTLCKDDLSSTSCLELGSVVTYIGYMTRFISNICVELDGGDFQHPIWLIHPHRNLTHLRKGTQICIYHAHLIRKPQFPFHDRIHAFSVCAHSFLSILKFGSTIAKDTESPLLELPISPRYSSFILPWLLILSQNLSQQFHFGTSQCTLSFPRIRLYEAVEKIAQSISPKILMSKIVCRSLGSLFLDERHESDPIRCSGIAPFDEKLIDKLTPFITLAQLIQTVKDQGWSEDWHGKECCVLGIITGIAGKGDLQLSDRTGNVALAITSHKTDEESLWNTISRFDPCAILYRLSNFRLCHITASFYCIQVAWKNIHIISLSPPRAPLTMHTHNIFYVCNIRSQSHSSSRIVRGILYNVSQKRFRVCQLLVSQMRSIAWLLKLGLAYSLFQPIRDTQSHDSDKKADSYSFESDLIQSIQRFRKRFIESYCASKDSDKVSAANDLHSFLSQVLEEEGELIALVLTPQTVLQPLSFDSSSVQQSFVSDAVSKLIQSESCDVSYLNSISHDQLFFTHILPLLMDSLRDLKSPRQLSQFHRKATQQSDIKLEILDPSWHQPHLRSVSGLLSSVQHTRAKTSQSMLSCILRDLNSLETLTVHIDLCQFSFSAAFRPTNFVRFINLKAFITRASYKVHLNWCEYSAVEILQAPCTISLDSAIASTLETTQLQELYNQNDWIDRTVCRYVVNLVHVHYLYLKRKCRHCHSVIKLQTASLCWVHSDSAHRTRNCCIERFSIVKEKLDENSYLNTSARFLIDDGTAQADMFADNDTAYDVLRIGSRDQSALMHLLVDRVSELGYTFTGTDSLRGDMQHEELAYDHFRLLNAETQFKKLIQTSLATHRAPLVILGQRVYSEKQRKYGQEHVSVVSIGTDVKLTTKTVALKKIQAIKVDDLHVKVECQRLLSKFRSIERE